MPIETRPSDDFTTDNLLIGFSRVEFERLLSDGSFATPVDMGILANESLEKEVTTLQLPDGQSGSISVAREFVTRIEPKLQVELFNFQPLIAELIFGSTDNVAVVKDAAKTVTNEIIQIPTSNPTQSFIPLANSEIDDTSFTGTSVTCATITNEKVGTGDGIKGGVDGDFSLAFKPLVLGDVTSITVGGTAQTIVSTEPAAGEVQVTVGTGSTSGQLDFGTIPPAGAEILATYTPSHSFAKLTDYVTDPLFGRIRFLSVGGSTDALKAGQKMFVDYTYNQRAGVNLKPFTRLSSSGKLTIRHLPDIGSNFKWTIPSVSIVLTGDALQFGAEDFVKATLQITINDAGGTDRFGTLFLADETQSAA